MKQDRIFLYNCQDIVASMRNTHQVSPEFLLASLAIYLLLSICYIFLAMKKLIPFLILMMISSGCVFQSKTTTDESTEKKTVNTASSNSEVLKSNNNSASSENRESKTTELPKVNEKQESKSHENLQKKDIPEEVENLEGDDENEIEIVKFAKGKTSATYEYGLVRGERRTYIVEAKKGQTMAVRIESEENNAVFNITKNGKILGTAEETDKWTGTLPSDGKYEIEVGGTRGNTSYVIEISVE